MVVVGLAVVLMLEVVVVVVIIKVVGILSLGYGQPLFLEIWHMQVHTFEISSFKPINVI